MSNKSELQKNNEILEAVLELVQKLSNVPTMDLLWENASPTSDFAPQTISLDLSNYDAVLIDFAFNNGNYIAQSNMSFTEVGRGGQGLYLWADTSKVYHRSFTTSETGVAFTKGWAAGSEGAGTVVPIKIYGIKGLPLGVN